MKKTKTNRGECTEDSSNIPTVPVSLSSLGRIPGKQPRFVSLRSHGRLSSLRFVTSAAPQLVPAHPFNYRASHTAATPADPTLTSDLRPDCSVRLRRSHRSPCVSTMHSIHSYSAGCLLMKREREQSEPSVKQVGQSYISIMAII